MPSIIIGFFSGMLLMWAAHAVGLIR